MSRAQHVNGLTIQEKLQIITAVNNKVNKNILCAKYGCDKSTIYRIMKRQTEIQKYSEVSELKRKRQRKGVHDLVEEELYKWFKEQDSNNLDQRTLLAKAKEFCVKFNDDYEPSVNWLWRWRKRHNIKCRKSHSSNDSSLTANLSICDPLAVPPNWESATKPDVADDEYFNNSNFESQDESWSGDTGTQSSFQVPELAIDVEEEKYSETLKRTESTQKMEDRHTASLDNAHSSSHLPVLTSDEEEQKSHINTYKRHRETTDRLATMVANLIEHQNTLFTQRPNQQSSLQHPEMYAFWDSIIKDIPPEALPEIKFEVTAVLHSIYKKYKN
ncbi:uncharacterized protein LOC133846443 isoform X2 [Drosophila sulfurigaster albostrigata]|uniref:uncharacterized protein LOC133846443 isoform X2 n=1 Tax=Drosophila sulfurigaster albostrigata TaxID=89887 RepID=UPI002D21C3BB|nr:uncharacterized protein LOC133846443 isoform X2 [Drosophila sulfurigaster albostrigata]